jgi:hypothetical protein
LQTNGPTEWSTRGNGDGTFIAIDLREEHEIVAVDIRVFGPPGSSSSGPLVGELFRARRSERAAPRGIVDGEGKEW